MTMTTQHTHMTAHPMDDGFIALVADIIGEHVGSAVTPDDPIVRRIQDAYVPRMLAHRDRCARMGQEIQQLVARDRFTREHLTQVSASCSRLRSDLDRSQAYVLLLTAEIDRVGAITRAAALTGESTVAVAEVATVKPDRAYASGERDPMPVSIVVAEPGGDQRWTHARFRYRDRQQTLALVGYSVVLTETGSEVEPVFLAGSHLRSRSSLDKDGYRLMEIL